MKSGELSDRVIDVTPEKKIGRPKGSKNKSTLFKEILAKEVEEEAVKQFGEVVRKTFELAKAGDTTCMKILWDKFYASQKAIDGETGGVPVVNISISGIDPKEMVIGGDSGE